MTSIIFGVRLDDLASVEQLRGAATGFLDGARAYRIFTPNPEILLRARDDAGYADLLRSADLALPDGTGVAIVQALRSGRPVRRWPGWRSRRCCCAWPPSAPRPWRSSAARQTSPNARPRDGAPSQG